MKIKIGDIKKIVQEQLEHNLYEVIFKIVNDIEYNKTDIINEIRAIKNVTVVSITDSAQNDYEEITYIKVKFYSLIDPIKMLKNIKSAAMGRPISKSYEIGDIEGLKDIIYYKNTLRRVY
jgi:hypothetical protein